MAAYFERRRDLMLTIEKEEEEEELFKRILDLMLTIGKEKEEEFKAMIKQNHFLVRIKNNFRMTLLHIAARNGNIEICKILIENGADPSFPGGVHRNQTALHCAAENSYFFAIYLTLLTKQLNRENLTPLLMQILKPALNSNLTEKLRHLRDLLQLLMQILPQITPEIFVSTLIQILKQANPKDFSPDFKPILIHVQKLEPSSIKAISELIPILQHTNDLQDFSLLLEPMLNKINLKISISSVIHFSSLIFRRPNPPEDLDLDQDILAQSSPSSPGSKYS